MFSFFARAWRGEALLINAFWFIFFLFGVILKFLILELVPTFFPNFVLMAPPGWMMGMAFPYTLYSAICVWRCGDKSFGLWRVLSRIVVSIAVVLGAIYLVSMLIKFFVLA